MAWGAWLIQWGDNLIIGRFLGIHDLGVYRTGMMLVAIIFGLFLNPFLPVVYPTFARLQEEPEALARAFQNINRVIIALALPLGLGLWLVGPEMEAVLFRQKWEGLGLAVGVLGLMNGSAWLVGLNAEVYRAIGRPDLNTKLTYAQLIYYLPAYYLAAQHGFQTFIWTRLAVALVATPIHILLCVKILRLSPLYIWQQGKPMICAALVMFSLVTGLKYGLLQGLSGAQGWILLGLLVCSGAVCYGAVLWFWDRPFILKMKSLLNRATAA